MRAWLLFLIVALASAPHAWATTADDLCAPGADPCIVPQGKTVAVTNGSVIDLGDRALVLAAGSGTRLDAGTGDMTIIAGSVTLNPGSALLARSGAINVLTTGSVSVLRAGTSKARIDVGDFSSPGIVSVDAGDSIEVQGVVTAQGAGADASSGSVGLIAGGNVTVSGEVNASAGGNSIGGDVDLHATSGDVVVSGIVDVTAGISGGTISLSAGGSVNTIALPGARLDAKAVGVEGDGGGVDVSAANGDVAINIPIMVQGTSGVDVGGGGGDVSIDAMHGSITLNASVDLSGAIPDGDGGDLDAAAGLDVTQTGQITSLGRDQLGVGGSIDLFGQRTVTAGPVNVTGTCLSCAGGDVNLTAWCSVVVPGGAVIDASGSGGGVDVRSGDDVEIHGTIRAGQVISIRHRDAANPPDLSGALLSPAPTIQVVGTLVPCGGIPAASCGNGKIESGEACDDGNKVSCDGCSSTCQIERCGDGRVGCDEHGAAEACDDGNTVGCDGCAADCSRRDRVCGDGTVECGEECDTGAAVDCDAGACSAQCRAEGCGNGRVECNEQCDDGGGSESCSDSCVLLTPPMCGDGRPDPGEGCDDGNTDDCDGCSHLCQVEGCGNGTVECDEECDDFNTTACDGCSGTCRIEACGNDVIDCGEECDLGDENGKPGTTCLACQFAPICSAGSPGVCIPCNDVLDCDPLGRCAGTNCLDGICTPDPVDCTSDDPCEVGSCDAVNGCMFSPVLGFDSVRCRLNDLDGMLGSDAVSDKARAKLGQLVGKSKEKVDAAEAALGADKPKRVGKSLAKARGAVVRFGKKVVKLQPKQITDPAVGAALSEGSGDALGRIETLRGDLGL